jgi:phosphoribosylformimino-5-aminoimidazole carboxamide ribotide isomerase
MKPVLLPAIDVRGGRVVRLAQGDYNRETEYGDDPVSVALSFVEAGATWIHIVDLDAAKGAGPINREVINRVAAATKGVAAVQTGGGVRTLADAQALYNAGVSRVVMGSAAVADPPLVAAVAEIVPVAVGLDHRSGRVATQGWTQDSELLLTDALGMFTAASAFVITDISRDGMLEGPDISGLTDAVAATGTPVVASGGVSSLDDIAALAKIDGLWGIITGRAVYEGRVDVAEAVTLLKGTS